MGYRILISCIQLQDTFDRYEQIFDDRDIRVDRPKITQQLSESELMEIIAQYDGVIAGDDFFTRKVFEAGKKLKIVAKWGVGVDNIDQLAAKELGIEVVNTPNMFADEVSDAAMGYILLLARGQHIVDAAVRSGQWMKIRGNTLSGKSIGVIGLGSIGQAVVRRAIAFGMIPHGFDIMAPPKDFLSVTDLKFLTLNELYQTVDYLVLCCSLTEENHHMIDSEALALMKDGVRIVNVARGPLIDEKALLDALISGKVGGAGLDVFESEPLSIDHPFVKHENCILGSHNGSNTVEGVIRTNERAIHNLFTGLELDRQEVSQ